MSERHVCIEICISLCTLLPLYSTHPLVRADVRTQSLTGVAPDNHVTVPEIIGGTAVIREPAVDLVHPAGEVADVKLIEVMDALDVGGIVDRRVLKFHVDLLLLAGAL